MQLRRRELRRANELSAHTYTRPLPVCQCVCKLRCQRNYDNLYRNQDDVSCFVFLLVLVGESRSGARVLTSVWERRAFLLSSSFTLGRFVFVCLFDMSGGGLGTSKVQCW